MRKHKLYTLFFLGCYVFGCHEKSLSQNAHDFAKMTEVLSAPPNAAALGKYGGLDITLNTGMVSKTIPLYNFKTSQLELPISLAYSSSGFNVHEAPSRTGVGWTLNLGGVITKTIVGEDDDSRVRIVPPSQILIGDFASYEFLSLADSGYDPEPDIYNFNFNGYTGKFVYDVNDQIAFIPANNLKVEKNVGGYKFKITTPDGVIYYFGGTGAIEQNKKTSSCGKSFDIWVPTAFYLSKIVSPLGQEINFTYESVLYDYLGTLDESMYAAGVNNAGEPKCTESSGGCPVYNGRTCQYTYTVQGIVLKQVTCSQIGSVNIEYTYQSSSLDSLFSAITVKDINGAVKKSFEFSYNRIQNSLFANSFQSSTYRDFLENITEKSICGPDSKEYKFSYNNLNELPVQNTFAADHWGFFNGKSNTDFIEKPFNFYDQSVFPNALADREPDYHYALKGLLCKIEYPTRGYDTIIYEGNDCYLDKIIPPPLVSDTTIVTGTGLHDQVTNNSGVLSVNSSATYDAKLEYTIINTSGGSIDSLHNKGSVTVTDLTTSTEVFYRAMAPDNSWHSEVIFPTIGHTYQITVTANGTVITTKAIFHYRPGSISTTPNRPVGGVRVKSVYSYADRRATPSVKNYYYAFLDSLSHSSGGWQADPYYLKAFFYKYICNIVDVDPPQCFQHWCSYTGIFSTSQNSMSDYPGGVTYQAVVEGFGNDFENGAVEHVYTVQRDQGAFNLMEAFDGDLMAGVTADNNSYYNGKELRQTVFKKSGSQLIPVEKTEYTYKIDSSKSMDVIGCAVNRRYEHCQAEPHNPSEDFMNSFNAMRYYHYSRWVYVDTIKQTKYDDNGVAAMTSIEKNYYDNPIHMLLSRSETKTSSRDIILSQTKYSSDFGTLTGSDNITRGIKALNDKYILNAPVEKTTFKKDSTGSNQRLAGSTFMSYKISNYKPDTIFQMEQASPITNFTVAVNSAGVVTKDNRYKAQVNFIRYDLQGNIVQQKKSTDVDMTYIWDYQSLYPVAGITNSDSASVAYTSFEADGKGNWSFTGTPATDSSAVTGVKAYVLNGSNNITKSGLNSGTTYILSYWTKNTSAFSITGTISGYPVSGRSVSGWKYFEHRITGQTSVTISGTGSIDEIRLYPSLAQMTTYTIDPLVGMTCRCDANNRVTYYEYDGLGRLSFIRDQDKNILKKICYNYAGQEETCSGVFYNTLRSQSFTRNNCGTGTGSSVTYTVPEATYSSTISQNYVDSLAQAEINANGQAYANSHGTCIYSNVVKSGNFTKNNCGTDSSGSVVTYTVAAATYSSQMGQAFVDSLAQADVNANGQAYANSHGTCTVNCNTTNCNGESKKCINNICRTGVKVYTSSVWDSQLHKYVCTYHYEWSDGSWSGNYTELSQTQCLVGGE